MNGTECMQRNKAVKGGMGVGAESLHGKGNIGVKISRKCRSEIRVQRVPGGGNSECKVPEAGS